MHVCMYVLLQCNVLFTSIHSSRTCRVKFSQLSKQKRMGQTDLLTWFHHPGCQQSTRSWPGWLIFTQHVQEDIHIYVPYASNTQHHKPKWFHIHLTLFCEFPILWISNKLEKRAHTQVWTKLVPLYTTHFVSWISNRHKMRAHTDKQRWYVHIHLTITCEFPIGSKCAHTHKYEQSWFLHIQLTITCACKYA
jgi:hypothetical protein